MPENYSLSFNDTTPSNLDNKITVKKDASLKNANINFSAQDEQKLKALVNMIAKYDPQLGDLLDQGNVELNITTKDKLKGAGASNEMKDDNGQIKDIINISYEDIQKLGLEEDADGGFKSVKVSDITTASLIVHELNHAKDINDASKLTLEEKYAASIDEEYASMNQQVSFTNWAMRQKDSDKKTPFITDNTIKNMAPGNNTTLWYYNHTNYSYDSQTKSFTANTDQLKNTIKTTYNKYLQGSHDILTKLKARTNPTQDVKDEILRLETSIKIYDPNYNGTAPPKIQQSS